MSNKKAVFALFPLVFMASCGHIGYAASKLPVALYHNPSVEEIQWNKVLPPPPLAGSTLDKIEMEMVIDANSLKNTARWEQAKSDAGLDGFIAFSPVLGANFTQANNPEISTIFDMVLKYSFAMSKASKSVYDRKRPFELNDKIQTCPNSLAGGSSYPSGHAALGWANAQILARIYPQYHDDLMVRGIEYGKSRMVCGVHYPSDIVAGRIVGDVLLQKLYLDAEFTKLLQSAQEKAKLGGKSPQ